MAPGVLEPPTHKVNCFTLIYALNKQTSGEISLGAESIFLLSLRYLRSGCDKLARWVLHGAAIPKKSPQAAVWEQTKREDGAARQQP